MGECFVWGVVFIVAKSQIKPVIAISRTKWGAKPVTNRLRFGAQGHISRAVFVWPGAERRVGLCQLDAEYRCLPPVSPLF